LGKRHGVGEEGGMARRKCDEDFKGEEKVDIINILYIKFIQNIHTN